MSFLAKISFGKPVSNLADTADDVIESWLAALLRNGQIYKTSIIKNVGFPLEAYVCIPQPGALRLQNSSSWVKKELEKIREVFGTDPEIEMLEISEKKRFASWKSTKALYLYTDMFDERSPVRSIEFEHSIPLYLLPIDCETRDYLTRWVDSYRDHDSIWIGSNKLSFQAYKELADPNSEICKDGLEYCKKIEKSTGKPTYFYLMRYYAKREGENHRDCPLCGKSWSLPVPIRNGFVPHLDFCCEGCRLVSDTGVEENNRYARVGYKVSP